MRLLHYYVGKITAIMMIPLKVRDTRFISRQIGLENPKYNDSSTLALTKESHDKLVNNPPTPVANGENNYSERSRNQKRNKRGKEGKRLA